MLYFNLVGTIADVDETTPENPQHPSPVLLLEIGDETQRLVVPTSAWSGLREVLYVGRRVPVDSEPELALKPSALLVGDLH